MLILIIILIHSAVSLSDWSPLFILIRTSLNLNFKIHRPDPPVPELGAYSPGDSDSDCWQPCWSPIAAYGSSRHHSHPLSHAQCRLSAPQTHLRPMPFSFQQLLKLNKQDEDDGRGQGGEMPKSEAPQAPTPNHLPPPHS